MVASEDRNARIVIQITDANLNDLFSNQALAELSGYEPAELDRLGWVNVLDPQGRTLIEEIVESVGKMPYLRECFDTNIICRDGSMRTLAWEVTALTPSRFPVMMITAHEAPGKRGTGSVPARGKTRPSIPNGLWNEIFDAMPECVSVHDAEFTILAANRALCDRLGLERSEVVGRKCHKIFHGSDSPARECVLVQALGAEPGARVRRHSYEEKFGCACETDAARIAVDPSGLQGIVHAVRGLDGTQAETGDRTTRRNIESQSHLANVVAHDYNNLLSGIVGYSGMLDMIPDLPEKARRYVEELKKASARLQEMTQRLLLFGRTRKPGGQRVDLNRLVEGTLQSPDVVPAERTVHFEKSESAIEVEVNPAQAREIVACFVANALESTEPGGGEVMVRTAWRRPRTPLPTYFGIAPPGDYALVEVRDTGLGLEPERLAHVFEPFSGPEHRRLGQGLSLATVYRMVQNHNGYLEVESERGIGSRFAVLFPASKDGNGG